MEEKRSFPVKVFLGLHGSTERNDAFVVQARAESTVADFIGSLFTKMDVESGKPVRRREAFRVFVPAEDASLGLSFGSGATTIQKLHEQKGYVTIDLSSERRLFIMVGILRQNKVDDFYAITEGLRADVERLKTDNEQLKEGQQSLFLGANAAAVVRSLLDLTSARVQNIVNRGASADRREAALRFARVEARDDKALCARIDKMLAGKIEHELPWHAFDAAWTAEFPEWTSLVGDESVVEFCRQRVGRDGLQRNCNTGVHLSLDKLGELVKRFDPAIAAFVAEKSRPPAPSVTASHLHACLVKQEDLAAKREALATSVPVAADDV